MEIVYGILYNSEGGNRYIVETYDINQIGLGDDKKEAIDGAISVIRATVEVAKKDPSIKLKSRETMSKTAKKGLELIATENIEPTSHNTGIPNYPILKVYDLSDRDIEVDED